MPTNQTNKQTNNMLKIIKLLLLILIPFATSQNKTIPKTQTCVVCIGHKSSTNDDDCWNSKTCYSGSHLLENKNLEKCQISCPILYNYCGIVLVKNDSSVQKISRFCSENHLVDRSRPEDPNRKGYSMQYCKEAYVPGNSYDDDDEDGYKLEICDETCEDELCNASYNITVPLVLIIINQLIKLLF